MDREGDTLVVRLGRAPCNEIGLATLADFEHIAAYLEGGADGARALLWLSDIEAGFCAGADLRELYAGITERKSGGIPKEQMRLEVRSFIDRIHRVFDIFDATPLVTVAALHGVVFGGGFELALTADVLVADKSARFCFPELRLGLVPGFGGIPRLRRDVGNAVVRDILFTGRSLSALRAHELGLVSQLVARGEAPAAARAVATQAARFDATVTRRAKAFTKPIPQAEFEEEKALFVSLFESPVVEEALRRFVTSTDLRPYLP